MASNIFSQTTTGEVNFQMITEPVFNQHESNQTTTSQTMMTSDRHGDYPQSNESLMQAIKMHHTKKFQINFSQINPLPIVDEVESSMISES